MIRGHQFNKVELFQFAKPDQSWDVFAELQQYITELLESLELHFQVSKLAAGDCSNSMAKTIDFEVWIPSMEIYKEVSSLSNALDYQARRADIRLKMADNTKTFPHTLNASGLATSRLIPALLEQKQQADGSIQIPLALKKYLPENFNIT
jgi:seryl-tRNA synthetase